MKYPSLDSDVALFWGHRSYDPKTSASLVGIQHPPYPPAKVLACSSTAMMIIAYDFDLMVHHHGLRFRQYIYSLRF